MARLIVLVVPLLLVHAPLAAQRVQRLPQPVRMALPDASESSVDVIHQPRPLTMSPDTRWKEGGIIGGVLIGLAGFFLFKEICDNSEEEHCGTKALAGGAAGAGAGFLLGALIGGRIHK